MAIEFIISRNTSNNLSIADSKLYINTDGTQFIEVDVDFIPVKIEVVSDSSAFVQTSTGEFKYTSDNGVTWIDSVGLPVSSNVLNK